MLKRSANPCEQNDVKLILMDNALIGTYGLKASELESVLQGAQHRDDAIHGGCHRGARDHCATLLAARELICLLACRLICNRLRPRAPV